MKKEEIKNKVLDIVDSSNKSAIDALFETDNTIRQIHNNDETPCFIDCFEFQVIS